MTPNLGVFSWENSDNYFCQTTSYSSHSEIFNLSDIIQCDGGDSINTTTSNHNVSSELDSGDEVDNVPEPVVLVPAAVQPDAGQPLVLEVDTTGYVNLPASLPLCMVTNFRCIYN